MILQISAQAPLAARAGAAALLWLHIGGASAGLAAGPIAMFAKKGGGLHRWSGTAFLGGMLAMSGVGAVVAPLLDDRGSSMAGLLAFYLTATGWAAVKRAPGVSGIFEIGAFLFAAGVAVLAFALAGIGVGSPDGMVDGKLPYQLPLVLGLILTLGAASDLRVVLKGGLFGPQRLARHLWRMSLAMAIAWGSFAAQPRALPPVLRGQPLMMLPALAILGLMVFWLFRVRPRRKGARRSAPAAPPAAGLRAA
jgi:hypothetical protein